MAFKCEICKARDAKRQFIGSVLNGEPEKELYICNECFEKLTPKLTWESLGPLLALQQARLGTNILLRGAVSTMLASATLKIYDKIDNKLSKKIQDFYKQEMSLLIYVVNKDRGTEDVHSLGFHEPYEYEGMTIFPFVFDAEIVNVYMSLDPNNSKNLINLVLPETQKYFSPAFNYIGIGVDYGPFDVVDFFDCLIRAVDLIDSFADDAKSNVKPLTAKMIERFLNSDSFKTNGSKPKKRQTKKKSNKVKETETEELKKKSKTKTTSNKTTSKTTKRSSSSKKKPKKNE